MKKDEKSTSLDAKTASLDIGVFFEAIARAVDFHVNGPFQEADPDPAAAQQGLRILVKLTWIQPLREKKKTSRTIGF